MGCIELCEGVLTAQKRTSTQIPIESCVNLSVFVSVSMSRRVNIPLGISAPLHFLNNRFSSYMYVQPSLIFVIGSSLLTFSASKTFNKLKKGGSLKTLDSKPGTFIVEVIF